jgi:autoinducer 2-degrading protein
LHILHVHIHIKPEMVDHFVEATLENVRETLKEPGVNRFDLFQQADDPTRFVLLEVYRHVDDQTRHKQTAHYKHWAEVVEPMLAEPRSRVLYQSASLVESGWA